MKLSLFFVLFDLLILLAYPIAFVIHRLRKMKGVK
jgi:NADH:ubiquinone oxidoreductase subunit 3 (subunit A)